MPQNNKSALRDKAIPFILLLGLWFALNGQITLRQTLLGILSAAASLLLADWLLKQSKIKPIPPLKGVQWFKFIQLLLNAIFSGGFYYFRRLFERNETVVFLSFELQIQHPLARVLIANTMTLSPGTVSVDIEKDVLKLLCYEPRTPEERKQLSQRLENLQDVFRKVDGR